MRFILASVFISMIVALGLLLDLEEGTVEAAASDRVLVSNIGYGGTHHSVQSAYDYAQPFVTGTYSNGYELDDLQIVFENATSTKTDIIMNPRIELYRVDSSGNWQPIAVWLDPDYGTPSETGEFIYTYNTPPGMDRLQPSTKYYITVARSSNMSLSLTEYTGEDPKSAIGWEIYGGVWIRGNSFDYKDDDGNIGMRLRLHGPNPVYIDFTGASDPKYASQYGGVRPLCERVGNGYSRCEKDGNGDIVIYVPEHLAPGIITHWYLVIKENGGEFRHWIEGGVDPNSGMQAILPFLNTSDEYQPITVITYDYETKNRYDMVLKVHDVEENITTSYNTTIIVEDQSDHPSRVRQDFIKKTTKNAAGTEGKRDVAMCWGSPWNAGRPPIISYDVRYRLSPNPRPDWTYLNAVTTTDCLNANDVKVDFDTNDIVGVTAMGYKLTDLEPNTDYEFDVRARNAQLAAPWYEHGITFNTGGVTAMQTAPPTPEPTPEPEPADPALTAEFHNVPLSHNGSDAFTLELRFSEDIPDLGYRTVRDRVLQLTNGGVAKAQRITKGDNQAWNIMVRPTASGMMTISLSATVDCTAAGAICIDDRKLVSNIATAVVYQ